MDEPEHPRPDPHTAGHDTGVILALLAQARREREELAPKAELAKERACLPAWGRWPW